MAILGDVHIMVEPEALLEKAEEVDSARVKIEDAFENITNIVNRTENYWLGNAGEFHRQLYISQGENINSIFARLQEHAEDLKVISGNYTTVENAATEFAQELPADVIV